MEQYADAQRTIDQMTEANAEYLKREFPNGFEIMPLDEFKIYPYYSSETLFVERKKGNKGFYRKINSNVQTKEEQMSEKNTTVVALYRKQQGELFLDEAAKVLGVPYSTIRGWHRMKWIKTFPRIGGYVVKASALGKVAEAINFHGRREWPKHVKYSAEDIDFAITVPNTGKEFGPSESVAQCVSASRDNKKIDRLAAMAKELFAMNESDLAHRISARAIQLY